MHPHIAEMAQRALLEIEPMAEKGWPPAISIARQLNWCLARALDMPAEPMRGPLTMGLMATREFDMYGDKPELALLIYEIQQEANRVLVMSWFKRFVLKLNL
jgi:hypothetical protein